MAQAATSTLRSIKRDTPFAWEGKDKRGARVKGKSLAPDEQDSARRTPPTGRGALAHPQATSEPRGWQSQCGRCRDLQPPAGHHAGRGIPLVQSFEIVGNGHEKAAMQRLILDVKADVEGYLAARGARQAPPSTSTNCS